MKGTRIHRFVMLVGLLLISDATLFANEADTYESLLAGETLYRNVVVRSTNETSLIVTHAGGSPKFLSSPCRPIFSENMGIADKLAARRESDLERMRRRQVIDSKQRLERLKEAEEKARKQSIRKGRGNTGQQFGIPPEIANEVDLRPKFKALGIGVRNQGTDRAAPSMPSSAPWNTLASPRLL